MSIDISDINPTQGNVIQPELPKELTEYEKKLDAILGKLKESKTVENPKEIIDALKERIQLLDKFPSYKTEIKNKKTEEVIIKETDFKKQNSRIADKANLIHVLTAQKILRIVDEKPARTFNSWMGVHQNELENLDNKILDQAGIVKVVSKLVKDGKKQLETMFFVPKEMLDKSEYFVRNQRFKEMANRLNKPLDFAVTDEKEYNNIEELLDFLKYNAIDIDKNNCIPFLNMSDQLEINKVFEECVNYLGSKKSELSLIEEDYDNILNRIQKKMNNYEDKKTQFQKTYDKLFLDYVIKYGSELDEKLQQNLVDYGTETSIELKQLLVDPKQVENISKFQDLLIKYSPSFKQSLESFDVETEYLKAVDFNKGYLKDGSSALSIRTIFKKEIEKLPISQLDKMINAARGEKFYDELKFLIGLKGKEISKLIENGTYTNEQIDQYAMDIRWMPTQWYKLYKDAFTPIKDLINQAKTLNRELDFTEINQALIVIAEKSVYYEDYDTYNEAFSLIDKTSLEKLMKSFMKYEEKNKLYQALKNLVTDIERQGRKDIAEPQILLETMKKNNPYLSSNPFF